MNELIKIEEAVISNEKVNAVSARELHKVLGSRQDFSTWVKNRIEKAKLRSDIDYVTAPQIYGTVRGGHATRLEYYLSLDAAKHVALMESTDVGVKVRDYFIECEKSLRNVHYDLIPKTLPEALEAYAKEIRAHQQTQALLEEAKPKVQFYDLAMETESTVDMKQAAKILDLDSLGRNRLFAYLRSKGILDAKNQPYQEYIDKGWFKLVEVPAYNDKEGAFIHIKTVVKQKGLDGISKLLLKDGFSPRGV